MFVVYSFNVKLNTFQVWRTGFHGCNYKESDRRQRHQSQRARALGDNAQAAGRFCSGELSVSPRNCLFLHVQCK